jgi:hypothetical protein
VRFVRKRDSYCVAEVLVNRDPAQHASDDPFDDAATLRQLLDALAEGELGEPGPILLGPHR